jgi:hypothetical protein
MPFAAIESIESKERDIPNQPNLHKQILQSVRRKFHSAEYQ